MLNPWPAHRRKLLLDANEINLNAATLSPTPKHVFDHVTQLRTRLAKRPTSFFLQESATLIQNARKALAKFIRAKPKDVILTPNVTHAMLMAIEAIPLKPGDRVLTTTIEYGAMLEMWKRRATRDGIHIDLVHLDPSGQPFEQQLAPHLKTRTRVLFFSHVSSPTGLVLDAAALAKWGRSSDLWVIVDGAHAVGAMPVDIASIAADAYGANVHKWMMGPCGCGFLHVSQRLKHHLRPIVPGWGEQGFSNHNIDQLIPRHQHHGTRLQFRLEYMGVGDRCPQLALPLTVDFLHKIGLPAIWERQRQLTRLCIDMLEGKGLQYAGSHDPSRQSSMPIFWAPVCR